MVPLSLAFQVRCSRFINFTRTHKVRIVRDVHQSAAKIHDIEAKHRIKQRSARYTGVPVFGLHEMDINIRAFDVYPALLNELRRFMELGIHVTSLTLPERVKQDEDVDEDAFFSAWVSLARAITGQGARPTTVSRVTLPQWYWQEPYLAAFCSALATAQGLRFLRLESGGDDSLDYTAPSEITWAWLGYGLFHPLSTSSVEALSLKGFTLCEKHLDTLEDSLDTNWDSLWYVWRRKSKPLGPSKKPPVRRQVVVMKGTVLQLKGGKYCGRTIVTSESVSAIVMTDDDDDDTSSQPLDVMVPGFGFCEVDQSSLQKKKQRRTAPGTESSVPTSMRASKRRGMTTLLLELDNIYSDSDVEDSDSDHEHEEEADTSGSRISRLLVLVGSTLTSLSIEAEDVNDSSLSQCLDECPLLENLRLGRMELESMAPLVRFHAQGRRLTSLELRDFSVPIDHFDGFVRAIADDQNDVYRLGRLSLGHGWSDLFRKSTSDALIHLLETNKRLTHMHLFTTETWMRGENAFHDFAFSRFRGSALNLPLDVSSRIAFLSVVRPDSTTSDHNPRNQLTDDLVKNVFDLGAFAGRRVVVREQDSFLRVNRYD